MNPNGILIHDGATVNVGNLYLSTRNLTDGQLASYSKATGALFPGTSDNGAVGDVINMGNLNAKIIKVEGKNITFKNVADVKNAADETGNTLLGGNNVCLYTSGEIHIGSENGSASRYTINYNKEEIDYKLIKNAVGLQAMTLGDNYMLANSIDMGNTDFSPVGANADNPFTGRFDGLNYTLSNLRLTPGDDGIAGLFGVVGANGVVENLKVAGTTTAVNSSMLPLYEVGTVAGINEGVIRNVSNTSTIDASRVTGGVDYFGGIVGLNKGTIDRVYNTGDLKADCGKYNLSMGGIAGRNGSGSTKGVITSAFNGGTITDVATAAEEDSFVGGIAGYMDASSSRIENAYNSGSLTSNKAAGSSSLNSLGGIVGYSNEGAINCT